MILVENNGLDKTVDLMEVINTGTMLIITVAKNEFEENLRLTLNNLNKTTSPILLC